MTKKERARLAHVEEDMLLPKGETCGNCKHYERCQWLLSIKGWEGACDWCPSRFVKAETEPGR